MSTVLTANVITIPNHHGQDGGNPPDMLADWRQYTGYFENEHGEQWLFVYDRETKAATLRGGDTGWEKIYEVVDGVIPGLILSDEESLWLHLCWKTAKTWEK